MTQLCCHIINFLTRVLSLRVPNPSFLPQTRRYGRSSTLSKLPTWLTGAITKVGGGDRAGSDGGLTFGPAFSAVARFFQGKRAQQEAAEHARAVKHSTKSYHKL
eukprot:TRINITY_DN1147_c3_g1_i10.p1 TRINITY_DN1147_c3_g1~~TRINITY_DN1147_c3_g1_i10.p1  ORF type:complete len:104 (-),score=1.62 TRINITY_DN1147_c3_g1_i10:335-646(-)